MNERSSHPNQGNRPNNNNNRRHHHRRRYYNNKNRDGQGQERSQNSGPKPAGFSVDKTYEKYLNFLDQHLIARKKHHDLFYRADPAQKAKLERQFNHTLHELREFEKRLSPELKELFEKRNNGLRLDLTYTTNHQIDTKGEEPPAQAEWRDPHYLNSQEVADYSSDKEESVGTMDDYLRYKNLN